MSITRGDSVYWTLPLQDTNGNPYPLNNCTIWVTYKKTTDQADTAALFAHSIALDAAGAPIGTPDGMKVGPGGPSAGVILERLSPEESAAFAAGDYVYDVQVRCPSATWAGLYDIWTPIVGERDSVILDVTQTTTPTT